jgi:putative spermidine/putrescine transport system substrate-binding protein
MSKAFGIALAAASASVFALPAFAQMQSVGEGEGQVDIVAWPGYIERGETDKAYDWVTDFEGKTGCKVRVKTAGTSDEMVALMNEGGFDLVTASGDASLRLIAGKRVQPVNVSLIPSWGTVDERLQNSPWHTVNGQHYGVPYQWGANVLMYNTDVFKDGAEDSWNCRLRADADASRRQVQQCRPRAGLRRADLHRRCRALPDDRRSPSSASRTPTSSTRTSTRRRSSCSAASARSSAATGTTPSSRWTTSRTRASSPPRPGRSRSTSSSRRASRSPAPCRKSGATGWADTTMMHTDAPHPNCAYMWLEHSINPKLQGDLAAWFGSVPAVLAACKGNALLGDEGCATNGEGNFDKIHFWRTPVSKCEANPDTGCVPYYRWVSDYIAILGGR